jgi:hypothetical protein
MEGFDDDAGLFLSSAACAASARAEKLVMRNAVLNFIAILLWVDRKSSGWALRR